VQIDLYLIGLFVHNSAMIPTRILLADDHALVRAGIRNALEDQPALNIVGEVGDGPGVMQALDTLRPDLLLIDLTMPNFEPIAAIRRIRMLYPDLRILVVSAYDDDVYVQGMLREGVNGYHLKDQPLSDLRLAVERVLAGKRWIDSSLVDKLLRPVGDIAKTPHLSPRQLDILHLLSKGLDNRAIAAQLGISVKTVETHLTRLYRQLNVQSRLEAVNYAHEHPEITVRKVAQSHLVLPQKQQTSILVVDDNDTSRSILCSYLDNWNVRCDETGDVYAVLPALRDAISMSQPFDVVLLDHFMPKMDSEKLADMIKSDPDLSDTHLIMLGTSGGWSSVQLTKSGIESYIIKPPRQSELYNALLHVTGRKEVKERDSKENARTNIYFKDVNILLVDDVTTNQVVGSEMLAEMGIRPVIASNGQEALRKILGVAASRGGA